MSAKPTDVAIIGAGLAGCLLALSLHEHLPLAADKITIYESRPPTAPELSSGVILTPNGLNILSKLGVYPHIKDICWTNGYRTYKNDKDETTRRVLVASEALYGFKNHRIYRRVLLHVLKDMLAARGITISYHQRFEGITSDTASGVTFTINGTPQKTNLLVGADGIYSSVRRHISPITPEYTGTVGCLAHIKWSSITWPSTTFERQCTIQGQPGAIFMIPETHDGEDVMVGKQIRHTDMSRSDWESFSRDTHAMTQIWRDKYDQWHPTGRKVIDAVTSSSPARETLYLWPFLRMPRLDRWSSPTGNVALVGDAAHAVPPSSGQGVNQALEDVWSLTLLLRGEERRSRDEVLEFWRGMRQDRVDAVFEWATNATNVARLGEEERRVLIKEGKIPDPEKEGGREKSELFFDDMAWLYGWTCERVVGTWLSGGGDGDGNTDRGGGDAHPGVTDGDGD